jgi:hypothetical protein
MTLKRNRIPNSDRQKRFYGIITHNAMNKIERLKLFKTGCIEKGKHEYYLNCPITELKNELMDISSKYSMLSKFRIFEGNLRVRDFSFNNVRLDYRKDGSIEFIFAFKGDPNNQIYFNSDCDILLDYLHGQVLIYVNAPVYFFDGTRRYSQQFNE